MPLSKAKQSISSLSYRIGLTQSLVRAQDAFLLGKPNSFRILIYHRVNDYNDPFSIDSVPANDFYDQMRYLSKWYRVLPLDAIYDHIQNGINLPNQCIAITFDDGYSDNYTFAYPILKKYNLPATIFVTAGCVENKEILWFDQVLVAFKKASKKRFASLFDGKVFDIQDTEKRLRAAHTILEQLKKIPADRRNDAISDQLGELGVLPNDEQKNHSQLLTWAQIEEMANHTISIGSHTMTHQILTTLPPSELQWELEGSRQLIEKQIGQPVAFFAYPNGKPADYNGLVLRAVKQAGYKAAVTTSPIINDSTTDSFTWGRYTPWQKNVEYFSASLFLHGIKNWFSHRLERTYTDKRG